MPSAGKQKQPRPAVTGPPVRGGNGQDSSHQPRRSNGKLTELQDFEKEVCDVNGANRGVTWSGSSGIFSEKDVKDE